MVVLQRVGAAIAVFVLLGAAACERKVMVYSLTYDAYDSSPVIVTEIRLFGDVADYAPLVAYGQANLMAPRGPGANLRFLTTPMPSPVEIQIEWTELLTGRAYTAGVTAELDSFDLRRAVNGYSTAITPVFGPNGLLIIASDPIPTNAETIETNDVVKICGTRLASADKDWRSDTDKDTILGHDIGYAYEFAKPQAGIPECPYLE